MLKDALIVLGSFLACSVEMVEALTIVLAVGITRGWRTAMAGVGAGFVTLAAVVAALGPALVTLIPLGGLQVVIGTLLLIFGMQWLRKAILRSAGLKAMHDEDDIYRKEVSELRPAVAISDNMDWTGFVVSFKGVFLEGLEVAFIVLTFGANSGATDTWGLSALGALIAFGLVGAVGLTIHRPLSRVPENSIKFSVGLMLMAFGTFWAAEGVGIEWEASDVSLLLILGFYGVLSWAMVRILKSRQTVPAGSGVAR